jgi:hypothetical protein
MTFAALLLWVASGHVALLRDDVSQVPPSRWRYDEFVVKEQVPVEVDCEFHVRRGAGVRVELVTAENLARLRRGEEHEYLASVERSDLRQEIRAPGSYAIVVFDDDKVRASEVALRLSLDFTPKLAGQSRSLSPQRKLSVVLISFVGFLAIVTVSARKLLLAMREPPE